VSFICSFKDGRDDLTLMGRCPRNEGSVEATAPPVKWRGSNPLHPAQQDAGFFIIFWLGFMFVLPIPATASAVFS
jgi:hypothetical protein